MSIDEQPVQQLDAETIWEALQMVKDPEIPVVSVVEMGIVRDVSVTGSNVQVTITPTFSGCPALHVMQEEIKSAIAALGATSVNVETTMHPPWSSDWISDAARAKLKAFGLAPPARHQGNIAVTFYEPVSCPYCDSNNTTIKNTFGPTLCRAIHFCEDCCQPFEQFKAI